MRWMNGEIKIQLMPRLHSIKCANIDYSMWKFMRFHSEIPDSRRRCWMIQLCFRRYSCNCSRICQQALSIFHCASRCLSKHLVHFFVIRTTRSGRHTVKTYELLSQLSNIKLSLLPDILYFNEWTSLCKPINRLLHNAV